MPLPRIGITTSYNEGKQSIDHTYIQAIEQAGGLPIIAPVASRAETARAFCDLIDGLVITGGPGITRGLIGTLPDDLAPVEPARDHSDQLLYQALADRPILGICYGMQFVNAMAGGTIYADLAEQVAGAEVHSPGRGAQPHAVQFSAGSRLRALLGEGLIVNTYHIQAVAGIGESLRPVGYSPDGIVEAVESIDGRIIGVQFHPERMLDSALPLFEDFVRRCGSAR